MLAFYPTYLAMLAAGRSAAALLSRISVPPLLGRKPAYARISVAR
jgi:hypothetical protein